MNIPPEEERFATNTITMAQAVKDGVERLYNAGYRTIDPNMITMVVLVIQSFDKHYLIQGFIENSQQLCWGKIKERDETFFIENAGNIFKYLPTDKVNLFKDLYTTKDATGKCVVSQTLKDQIWDLFDAMIKISIKYVHKHRSPYSYATNDGIVNTYGAEFFEEVDLKNHSDLWNVKLDFPMRP